MEEITIHQLRWVKVLVFLRTLTKKYKFCVFICVLYLELSQKYDIDLLSRVSQHILLHGGVDMDI